MPKITLIDSAILPRAGTHENVEHQAGSTHDVSQHIADRLVRLGVAETAAAAKAAKS